MKPIGQQELRQPGLIVYLCGFGTSALVLWLVHLSGVNIMGWYVNAILPAGALAVGLVSGLGYALASYFLNVKLSRAFVLGMLTTAFFDYWAAEYFAYTRILEQNGLSTDALSFSQYIQTLCTSMTFSHNGGKASGAIGVFGYAFKALEVVGFCGGMTIPSALLFSQPYCARCRCYLKKLRTGFVNSVETRKEIFDRPRKERAGAINEVAIKLVQDAHELTGRVEKATLDETHALLDTLHASRHKDGAAALQLILKKCPSCEAHHVDVSLAHVGADKRPAVRKLASIDKTVSMPS